MAQFLVMSAEAAEAVRGETQPGHAINPVALTDGRFILAPSVLDDPAHDVVWGYLMANTALEEIDPSLFPVRQSRRPQR
jgi:hypothetical protein